MAFGAIIPAALGSVTAPASITLASAANVTSGLASFGPCDVIPLPSLKAILFTHGVEAMRHVLDGSSYRTGLLAPATGFTATDTATKASSTLTLGAGAGTRPANNDTFNIGQNSSWKLVYWKTTLDTTVNTTQVKIGADVATCLSNLNALIEGTGTHGVEYWDGYQVYISPGYYSPDFWHDSHLIEVGALTATTIKIQARTAGTSGNVLSSQEGTDSVNTQSWSATPLMTGGAEGTGTSPGAGSFNYAEAHYRSADGALSAISTPYLTVTKNGNSNVSVASLTTLVTQDATDYRRVMRTLTGADVFWRIKDVSGSTLTDDKSDDSLAFEGNYQHDNDQFRPRVSGYPVVGRFGAVWRASLWVGGASIAAKYTTGTATGTVDTTTVTLSAAARPKTDMIGRYFSTADSTIKYLIVDVTPHATTPTLTLATPLKVAVGAGTAYAIEDLRDPFQLHKSVPTLINQFRPGDSFDGVTSRDTTGITGIVSIWDSLVVFTKTGVWRMTGNEGAYNLQNIGEGMGCHTGKAAVVVGGELYWLGPDGLWRWASDGSVPVCLSKVESDEPTGIQATIDRINIDDAEIIVSNYNPSSKRIRWWVPLDGEPTNRYVIRYDLQTRGFALQTDSDITEVATVPFNGVMATVAGDAYGHIWHLDLGYSDGAWGYEPVAMASSYTAATRTIGFDAPTFSTTSGDLNGLPVLILPAAGPPYEYGKIASSTSVQLVLTCQPSTAPAAGDYIIPGGIVLDLESTFDYEQPELLKWIEGVTVSHDIESLASELWLAAGINNDAASVFVPRSGSTADSALMTATDGEKHFWLRTGRGRKLKIRFVGIARGGAIRLIGFVVSIRTPRLEEVEG